MFGSFEVPPVVTNKAQSLQDIKWLVGNDNWGDLKVRDDLMFWLRSQCPLCGHCLFGADLLWQHIIGTHPVMVRWLCNTPLRRHLRRYTHVPCRFCGATLEHQTKKMMIKWKISQNIIENTLHVSSFNKRSFEVKRFKSHKGVTC